MALIRPVVLVFQEFANPTVTAVTPDLNCLIVGPAYFIMLIRETRRSGLGDVPMAQLAADARKGRRVRLKALEFAATAAFLLALFNPFSG